MADNTGAAFGVFPQMQPRRARQDREAAANAPLSALRGWAAGTAGLPGDIEGLLRMLVPGVSNEPALPTSEFYKEWLPGRSLNETPTGRAFTEAGGLTGGAGLGSLSRAAATGVRAGGRGALSALEAAARNAAVPRTLNPQAGVIKMKGGNWLSGSVEDSLKGLKQQPPAVSGKIVDDIAGTQLFDDYRKFYDAGNENVGLRQWVEQNHPEVYKQLVGEQGSALNNWIDKKLTSYVKNEMATPEDPIRALAEKWAVDKPAKLAEAQARIDALASKIEQTAGQRGVPPEYLTSMRQQMIGLEKEKDLLQLREGLHVDPAALNFRPEMHGKYMEPGQTAVAQSPMAKTWEGASDLKVLPMTSGQLVGKDEWVSDIAAQAVERNPWLAKVPPETRVYGIEEPRSLPNDLGFNHLIDELRNATNPNSGLPKELLLKYQDLPKITLPQAVDRVADINAWRAAQKIEADMARANNAATQVFKEYPTIPGLAAPNEKGLRWVELKQPAELPEGWAVEKDRFGKEQWVTPEGRLQEVNKDPRVAMLQDALKYEGDTMQHCVGGYCPDVAEGRSRIYSLRDAKGQPHVTVEVGKSEQTPADVNKAYFQTTGVRLNPRDEGAQELLMDFMDTPEYATYMATNAQQNAPRIVQIKGKGNKAPNEDVLPFVQDFVKSGKWSDVGDLGNTGLRRFGDAFNENEIERIQDAGIEVPTWATPDEIKKIGDSVWPGQYGTPMPGFAQGGLVQHSYDPAKIDALTQQLQEELNAA